MGLEGWLESKCEIIWRKRNCQICHLDNNFVCQCSKMTFAGDKMPTLAMLTASRAWNWKPCQSVLLLAWRLTSGYGFSFQMPSTPPKKQQTKKNIPFTERFPAPVLKGNPEAKVLWASLKVLEDPDPQTFTEVHSEPKEPKLNVTRNITFHGLTLRPWEWTGTGGMGCISLTQGALFFHSLA